MTTYRKYRREITDSKLKTIKTRHKIHLQNNGFLTKSQKERLLKTKKKERGITDTDFWYRIRHAATFAIFDLELISKIADESQLEEIFEPLTRDNYSDMDKGLYKRTDMRYLIEAVFSSHKPELSTRDDWRFKLAYEMIEIGIGYFRNMPTFQSNLHQRAFQDVLDSIQGYSDSTESGLSR